MNFEVSHNILVYGPDFDSCRDHVLSFFDKTQLVLYDSVVVNREQSFSAFAQEFWPRLENGVAAIKELKKGLLEELKIAGPASIDDLIGLQHGYPSKVLHVLAHILDGFVGIDSTYYNLIEDSHGITEALTEKIMRSPFDYWLLHVRGMSKDAKSASFLRRVDIGKI